MSYKKAPKVKRNKDGKYFMRPQDIFNFAEKIDTIIYRIGEHGLFQVVGEYEDYYVGHWHSGFYNQAVLKNTLRKLTNSEIDRYNSLYHIICGIKIPLNITQD